MEELVACFRKGGPIEPDEELLAGLRAAVRARRFPEGGPALRDPTFDDWFPPRVAGDWQVVNGAAPGFGKLLVLLAELDGASQANVELFASTHAAVAASIAEHDWCVLHQGWRPQNPAADSLYGAEAIAHRARALTLVEDPFVVRGATLVLASM